MNESDPAESHMKKLDVRYKIYETGIVVKNRR